MSACENTDGDQVLHEVHLLKSVHCDENISVESTDPSKIEFILLLSVGLCAVLSMASTHC